MTIRGVVLCLMGGLLLLFAGSLLGGMREREKQALAHLALEKTTDSLRLELSTRIARFQVDTVRVDSLITRWRTRLRVDTLPAQVSVVYDTLRVPLTEAEKDSIVETLIASRTECRGLLAICTLTNNQLLKRAQDAEASNARLLSAGGGMRWMERGFCLASVAGNILQARR